MWKIRDNAIQKTTHVTEQMFRDYQTIENQLTAYNLKFDSLPILLHGAYFLHDITKED